MSTELLGIYDTDTLTIGNKYATLSHMRTIDRRRLGARIRELRNEAGWTQGELARRAMIDRSYVSLVENARTEPSLDVLERIAGALGLRVTELLIEATSLPDERISDLLRDWASHPNVFSPTELEAIAVTLEIIRRRRRES